MNDWSEFYPSPAQQWAQKIKYLPTRETRWKIFLPTVDALVAIFDGFKRTNKPEVGRVGWGLDGLLTEGWPRSACLNALTCNGKCSLYGPCNCGRLTFQEFAEMCRIPGLSDVVTIERWWNPWAEAVEDGIAESALLNSVVMTPYTSLWKDYWQPVGKQYFDKETIVRRITEPKYVAKRVQIGQEALMDPNVAAKILREPAVRQSAVRTILSFLTEEEEGDIRHLHVVN